MTDPAASRLLRQLRERSGLSLRRVGADLGIAASHLSRIERGTRAPSERLLRAAADYYGVSEDTITLADGRAPSDILAILYAHPELLGELRERYGEESS